MQGEPENSNLLNKNLVKPSVVFASSFTDVPIALKKTEKASRTIFRKFWIRPRKPEKTERTALMIEETKEVMDSITDGILKDIGVL